MLAVGLAVGIVLVEAIVRRSDVGAGLVLGLVVVQEFAGTIIFGVGAFSVHANDLAMGLLTVGAVARILRVGRPDVTQRLLIGLSILVLWSLVRGIDEAGLTTAVNESRKYLGFVTAALYFSTIDLRQELFDRIVRMWLLAAAALCTLAFLRWGASTIGVTGGVFGPGGEGLRAAIPSDRALVVGQAALLATPLLREGTVRLLRYSAPFFLAFAFLLQHRTVWIVVATGVIILMFRQRTLRVRDLAILAAGLAVVAGVLFFVLDIGGDPLVEEVVESGTRTDTFRWRLGGWEALLQDSGPETLEETVVGRPFGIGWERRFDGIVVSVSPHSFYLETFLRVGLAGLAILISIYAVCLRSRRPTYSTGLAGTTPRSGPGALSSNVLISIVAGQLIYFFTYTPDMSQALLLGLACTVAVSKRRAEMTDRVGNPVARGSVT